MPRVPTPRRGSLVKVKQVPLAFSYWPMYRGTRRFGLQANVYATNPWALMRASIRERCPANSKSEALACVQQAEFMFTSASQTDELAAKPLLLYYSFLNAAKGFALTAGIRSTFDQGQHGIAERLNDNGKELVDAYLNAFPSRDTDRPNIFADFLSAVTDRSQQLAAKTKYDLRVLLPQVVTGHRLWCDAALKRERFVRLQAIQIRESAATKAIWLDLQVDAADLTRLSLSHKQLLVEAMLAEEFSEVTPELDRLGNRLLLRFEQDKPIHYSGRAADRIQVLIRMIRHRLWATVTTVPPYRQYYIYLAPTPEHNQVLPQLLSIYALMFYLGSITRYRPQHFEDLVNGQYGEHLQELLASQPNQFIYLLASEYAKRDVTRAAIV